MARRTVIVHASHLLDRGHLMVSADRKNAAGEPTNALFAATSALRRALSFKLPDVAVAVLDARRAGPVDPAASDLDRQHARWPAVLRAHGFHVVYAGAVPDVVASYTRAALEHGHDVVLVGSDKRLAQLVGDRVAWYDAYKDVRYTRELVRKRFEVEPERVAGWLALVGDDDRLPGVTGIGKKGATDLVTAMGSIEAAIERPEEAPGRPGKMLRASLDDAKRELARATLDRAVPLDPALEALSYEAPPAAELNALYHDLGFVELLGAEQEEAGGEVKVVASDAELRASLDAFGATVVAVHALTEDPSPARGALAGVALVGEQGEGIYVPLPDPAAAIPEPLAAWLADATKPKVGHELTIVQVALARRGAKLAGVVADSAYESHLFEPSNWAPHELPHVAKLRLRRALETEEDVRGTGAARKAWRALPLGKAAAHAGRMAAASLALHASFAPETPRDLLDEYLALADVVARMEVGGIACDADELRRAGEDFGKTTETLEAQIYEIAGKRFNLGSTKQLGAVLFEDLKLPIYKRTKTGWSTATEALERIELAHPIVALVIRWRELQRLRDSWVDALVGCIDPDGRIRSGFHLARSFSGRIVNTQPDLGRVPGRTAEMARIRRAFRAPPGKVLLSVDYRQLGLFVLAHLSDDPALVEPLASGDDLHRLTAAAVLDLPLDRVGPEERQRGKVVNFATFAGQGASALALQLGLPAAEAKLLIERFDRKYARVRAFQEGQLEKAKAEGFVVTIAGRKWPIGGLTALDPQLRSNAERMGRRATHEGSVADVSRRGLLRAAEAIANAGVDAKPLLQVHDEVLFEVSEADLLATSEIASAAMRGAFELRVPLRVGCKAGPTWGDLAPLALS